jgi:colanic acid/amylovoran biosynthesis glycosyltransferase
MKSAMRIAYFIGCYPFINVTFIEREIQALEAQGVSLKILAMVRPGPGQVMEEARWRMDHVFYVRPIRWGMLIRALVRFSLTRPRVFWGTLVWLLTRPHPSLQARLKTVLHFAQGAYLAEYLRGREVAHLHAHFADRATVAALVVSRLLDIPFSFTAHAKDIYAEDVFLRDKIARAAFVTTCTRANLAYLRKLSPSSERLYAIYHGLPLEEFEGLSLAPQSPPLVLAVGKLIEKKGFPYLLEACALLREWGYDFACTIIGEGPDREALETERAALGLEPVISLPGNCPFAEVLATMQRATVFTLPSIIARNGDRDGIPNVVLEAMAVGVPVVSTDISAIPEVVHDGETGLLVPQRDTTALAKALACLLDDGALRERLSHTARLYVAETFDHARNAIRMRELFEGVAGGWSGEARGHHVAAGQGSSYE